MLQINTQNVTPNTMLQNQKGELVPVSIIQNKFHDDVWKFHTEYTGPNKPTME